MSTFTLVFDFPHSKVARGSPVIFLKNALHEGSNFECKRLHFFYTFIYTLFTVFRHFINSSLTVY